MRQTARFRPVQRMARALAADSVKAPHVREINGSGTPLLSPALSPRKSTALRGVKENVDRNVPSFRGAMPDSIEATTRHTESPAITAYHVPGRRELEIVPAGRWRGWMEATDDRWPNRCLPLLMANESGWWLLNPCGFTVVWDGGDRDSALRIALDDPNFDDSLVSTMFGYGIVTWTIPILFRTDPGWDLLARGPANLPRDGIYALEGLVETDWATATFTMNWKMTRPDLPVRFEAGDPFCQIVPQRRNELEAFSPHKASLSENGALEQQYRGWERSRDEQIILKFVSQFGTVDGFDPQSWQKDYFRGQTPDGVPAADHQTKRRLRPFVETDDAPQPIEPALGDGQLSATGCPFTPSPR